MHLNKRRMFEYQGIIKTIHINNLVSKKLGTKVP